MYYDFRDVYNQIIIKYDVDQLLKYFKISHKRRKPKFNKVIKLNKIHEKSKMTKLNKSSKINKSQTQMRYSGKMSRKKFKL